MNGDEKNGAGGQGGNEGVSRKVVISNELLDRLAEIYQKYAFEMTFEEFLLMVIRRLEDEGGVAGDRR
jgi:hypothetical protein